MDLSKLCCELFHHVPIVPSFAQRKYCQYYSHTTWFLQYLPFKPFKMYQILGVDILVRRPALCRELFYDVCILAP